MSAVTGGPARKAAKAALRRELLDVRNRLTVDDVQEAAAVLSARAEDLDELTRARTVAAYVSVGREPGTRTLLDTLHARGARVLLPVLLPDNDLDWGVYRGAGHLVRAARGLLEPDGERLGPDAVTDADAVLLPGLAVDGRGMRLGRGGGSYDRVLARLERAAVRPTPTLVVFLYDDEVVAHVPEEPHDHPVHAVVTPRAVRRFRRT